MLKSSILKGVQKRVKTMGPMRFERVNPVKSRGFYLNHTNTQLIIAKISVCFFK